MKVIPVTEEIREQCRIAEGLDHAFVGIWYPRFNDRTNRKEWDGVAVYSVELILKGYMDNDGMDEEGASEFYEFNVVDAFVDEHPVFIETELF